MKNRIAAIVFAVAVIAVTACLLSACGFNDNFEENPTLIETQYCTLHYPDVWGKYLRVKKTEKETVMVEYNAELEGKDIVPLFKVLFDSEVGNEIGSICLDDGRLVRISVEICEIVFGENWSDEEKKVIHNMQDDLNYVIQNISLYEEVIQESTDVQPTETVPISYEDFVIETPYGKLYFPGEWKDYMKVLLDENEQKTVMVYGITTNQQEYRLYDICYTEDMNDILGVMTTEYGEKIGVKTTLYSVNELQEISQDEVDRFLLIQDTINDVLQKMGLEVAPENVEEAQPTKPMERENADITVETPYGAARKLSRRLAALDIPFTEKCFGLPFFLFSYRKRPGIFIGLALALGIIFLSGSVVWDIRVSGNTNVDTATVKRELAAAGFGLGSSVKTDVDRISNSLLARSDKISWLSINMSGTVAYVQIREEAHFAQKDNSPCNLVAMRDGTIERIESSCGTVCVEVGQSVKKGEILVSGVRGGKSGNYSLVQASGQVFAVVSRVFEVEVPFKYEAQVPISSENGQKYIKFFSKNIFFSKNSRKNTSKCVTIYMEENLSPPYLPPLPFGVVTELVTEYETVTKNRTPSGARDPQQN